ncbi:hypothetical protein HANVADRAFT_53486 [Hanseniaspora valbyensis NRRL Y-1626]|uniref:Altered inheritance of mitochondria protein 32 n=1 Tax=Hanseniaspora valbyensis NRRL Y-1626 TaxID=766949 RepID=A0A1B7TBA2_9ASCO|nr:hypothetical protein HANVADRAFT_53486 [Hanseniaspora valbyensis NRRL Y-1626]
MNNFLLKKIPSILIVQKRTLTTNINKENSLFEFVSIKKLIPGYKVLQENCNCYLNKLSETEKLSDPFFQVNFDKENEELRSEIPIFKRHLLLLDTISKEGKNHLNWISKIEKDTNFPLNVVKPIKQKNMDMMKENRTLPLMVNVLELINNKKNNFDNENYQVLSLPEWKIITFDKDYIKEATEFLNTENLISNSINPNIKITNFESEKILMVCGHNQRDRRCGIMTNEIISNKDLKEVVKYDLGVVSHIGGHKFAGNIAIYMKNRNGDNKIKTNTIWFRHVTPEVLDLILKQLEEGKIIQEFYRGSITF